MRCTATGFIIGCLCFAAVASAQPRPFDRPGGRGFRARPFAPPMDPPPTDAPTTNPIARNPPIAKSLPLNKQIDESIARGVAYLLAQQHDDGSFGDGGFSTTRIGQTGLAGLALLSSGMSHQS